MSLTDGDIAELARQAADRIDPNLEVRIVPADPVDPYRWKTAAWTVHAGAGTSYIESSMSAEEALDKLAHDLGH